ncbi:SCO family protein [Halomonas sp. DX6]|uniref:SCO family protein n=2 Tax=Billgrantia bachuensis TaxID=2717286 RepID=A0ABX0PNQ7_9GAMM|nr:SCO family protein [Halomonas bachuensis]NIC04743.1 SCO family protein [Halomonas bachuensis]
MLVSLVSFAHSLEDVENDLQESGRYAQFVDQPAPAFSLADADGQVLSLSELERKVVILNFVYTRCKEACPLHMNLIAQIQDGINESSLREDVMFITIATDTEDVPATRRNMLAYGENFDFDPQNWRFLYRSEGEHAETTKQLAEAYGLNFAEAEEGVQLHGVVTHVIDQTGRMRARFHGLKFETENLITYVNTLVEGSDTYHQSVWHRVTRFFTQVFN